MFPEVCQKTLFHFYQFSNARSCKVGTKRIYSLRLFSYFPQINVMLYITSSFYLLCSRCVVTRNSNQAQHILNLIIKNHSICSGHGEKRTTKVDRYLSKHT